MMNDDTGASPKPGQSAIEDAAIEWLTEREDGFTPAREREFNRWLHADPRHAAAVARIEQTQGLLSELPRHRSEINAAFDRAAPVVPFPPVKNRPASRVGKPWARVFPWGGLAAALVLGIALGWRMLGGPEEVRYTTTPAGYERAHLEDGSMLELNAASVARVQFSATERRVQLDAGEAHFAVAKDAARPFVVQARGVTVSAVGTAFLVRLAASEVEVIVVEGKVTVARHDDGARTVEAPTLVSAGERAVVPNRAPQPSVEKIEKTALREALAWQGRLVDFSDAPLAEVVARFNARNQLQLILGDTELGTRRIGGTFALDEAEAFARLLSRDGSIVVERRGATEIVLRRSP